MILYEWQSEDGVYCRASKTTDGLVYERRERGRGWIETSIEQIPLDDETPTDVLRHAVMVLLGDGYDK